MTAIAQLSDVLTHPARQRALEEYISALHELRGGNRETARMSAEIRVKGTRIEVGAWVVEQLMRPDLGSENSCQPWERILVQGVALISKTTTDINRLGRETSGPRDEFYRLQAELMLDTAIGGALLRDAQHLVDETVGRGELQQARRLTAFTHKLRAVVSEAKKIIADSEPQPRTPLEHPTRETRTAPRTGGDLDRLAQRVAGHVERSKYVDTARRKAGKASRIVPSRTELLTGLLAITVVAWLAITALPQALRSEQPRPLTVEDLRAEPILQVSSRPPSLFATVGSRQWLALSEEQRTAVVEEVAGLLLTHGYRGALIQTESGRPVAQWFVGRGTELIRSDEAAPSADEKEREFASAN